MKHIMLCCNAGMSTSLLVQKMQKYVAEQGIEVDIEARPMNEAIDHLGSADIVLLGPQIGYAKDDFQKATDKPVDVIPMMDYGRMNVKAIVDRAMKMLEG